MKESRALALAFASLLVLPAVLVAHAAAADPGNEAILAFDHQVGYHLGATGDLMRLEASVVVAQAPGTQWEMRILDPQGAIRARDSFVGASFSANLSLQLHEGDLAGAWRGEVRRFDASASAWVVSGAVVTGVDFVPLPGTPSLFASAADNRVDLAWSSTVNPPASYEVEMSEDADFTLVPPQFHLYDSPSTATEFVASFGTTYHVRVRVRDLYNGYGPWNATTVRTDPAVGTVGFDRGAYIVGPAGGDQLVARLRALGDADTIWRLQVKDSTGALRYEGTTTGSLAANLTGVVTLTAADPRGAWTAEVSSRKAATSWSLWNSSATTVADTVPPAPPSLVVSAHGQQVSATWLPQGGTGSLRYDAQLAADPSFTSPLVSLPSTTQQTLAYAGAWATTYYVRVRTLDAYGAVGPWSTQQAATDAEPLPDLVIGPHSVWLYPETPYEGSTGSLRVLVENRGTLAANGAQVAATLNGAPAGSATVTIPAGGSQIVAIPLSFPARGAAQIVATADPANAIRELAETNNAGSLSLTVEKPPVNLVIAPADVVVSPAVPTALQPATVTVTVHNVGTEQSGPAQVQLLAGETVLLDASVNVAPGGSSTLSATWTPAVAGAITLLARADPTNAIRETTENDNVATRSVTVGSRPDLVLEQYALAPTGTTVGSRVDVTMRVRNGGDFATPATTVDLTSTSPTGQKTLVQTLQVPALQPGGFAPLAGAFTPTAAGTWSLDAAVDPADAIAETSEANNRACASATFTTAPLADVSVALGSVDALLHGKGARAQVTVTNGGTAPAQNVHLALRLKDPARPDLAGIDLGSQDIGLLAPGEGQQVSFAFTPQRVLGFPEAADLVVEASTTSPEASLADDSASTHVVVRAPDLVVTMPSQISILGIESPAQGIHRPPTYATIENIGNARAEAITLSFSQSTGTKTWTLGTDGLTPSGLAPGESVTLALPHVDADSPGFWPAVFQADVTRASAAASGPVADAEPALGVEPDLLRGDNSLQPIFVLPGLHVSVEPEAERYDQPAFPLGSEAYLVVDAFGANAASYLANAPSVTSAHGQSWSASPLQAGVNDVRGVLGDDLDPALAGLTAHRVFRLGIPTSSDFYRANCIGTTSQGCWDEPLAGWTRKVQGDVPGVGTGFAYDITVKATNAATGDAMTDHTQPVVIWEGVMFRLHTDTVVVQQDGRSGELPADVIAVKDGALCEPNDLWAVFSWLYRCKGTFDTVRLTDAHTGVDLGFTVNWPETGKLDLKAPSNFDQFPLDVRLSYGDRAVSPEFTLIRSGPALQTNPDGSAQDLLGGPASLQPGGLHVLSLNVVALGYSPEEIHNAIVRLCYPSTLEVWDERGHGDWWGGGAPDAAALVNGAGQTPCPTGFSAAYRTMPLTRNAVTPFSFVARTSAATGSTVRVVADLFDENGVAPSGRTTAQVHVDQTLNVGPAATSLATDQYLRALKARVALAQAGARAALYDNDKRFVNMTWDIGTGAVDLALGALFHKYGDYFFDEVTKVNKGLLNRAVGTLFPMGQELLVDKTVEVFIETLTADDGGSKVASGSGAAAAGTPAQKAVDKIASDYLDHVARGDFAPGKTFTPASARDLVYKLDVAQNVYEASLVKDARWAMPTFGCFMPEVSPPQPGQLRDEALLGDQTICHNVEMHPLASEPLRYPNLLGYYHANQMVIMNSDWIKKTQDALSYLSLGLSLISIVAPPVAAAAGVADVTSLAADAAVLGAKTSFYRNGVLAYPVSQASVGSIFEDATFNPHCCTAHLSGAVSAGAEQSFTLANENGTTQMNASLLVAPGDPLPTLEAVTASGVVLNASVNVTDNGTLLSIQIPTDVAGNTTLRIRGNSSADPQPYTIAVGSALRDEVRFARLNFTAGGVPVTVTDVTAQVNGVTADVSQVPGGMLEVRATQGATLHVTASAPGYAPLDATRVVQLPDRFGNVDLALTPLVSAPAVLTAALTPGATGHVAVALTNPTSGAQTYSLSVTGLPHAIAISAAPKTLAAGASGSIDLALTPGARILPGQLRGDVAFLDAAGHEIRRIPLLATVTGPFPTLRGVPREVDAIAGSVVSTSVTLRNAGNAQITGIQAAWKGPSWITVVGAPLTLAAGAEATLTLVATPPANAAAGVLNTNLSITSMNAFEANATFDVHVFASASSLPQIRATGGDVDGDGVPDAVLAEGRGSSAYVGLRDASGDEVGVELASHQLMQGSTTLLDTRLRTPSYGSAPGETIATWSTTQASLTRVLRVVNGSIEVTFTATAPAGPAPTVQTVYLRHGSLVGDTVIGNWTGGAAAPALRLDLGAAATTVATFTTSPLAGARWRIAPAHPVDARMAPSLSGDIILSGKVVAVYPASFVLQDRSGAATVSLGGQSGVRVGDIAYARVEGDGNGTLALTDYHVTGHASVVSTPVDAAGAAALFAANGTMLVDVSGTVVSQSANAVVIATATGNLAVSYGSAAPAVAPGEPYVARGALTSATTLLSVPPTVRIALSGSTFGPWYTSAVGVSLVATGAASTQLSLDGVAAQGTSATATQEGLHSATGSATDALGNVAPISRAFSVDTAAPTTQLALVGPSYSGSVVFVAPSTTFRLVATDAVSGVSGSTLCVRGSCAPYASPVPAGSTEGPVALSWWSVDNAGHTETSHASSVTVDATGPAVDASFAGTVGLAGWWVSNVTATFSCDDGAGSGCAYVQYSLDNGSWTTAGASLLVKGEARHPLLIRGVDRVGNVGPARSWTLPIDLYGPNMGWSLAGPFATDARGYTVVSANTTLLLVGQDRFSGVAGLWYGVNAAASLPYPSSGIGFPNQTVNETIYANGTDNAGNVGPTLRLDLVVDNEAPIANLTQPPRNSVTVDGAVVTLDPPGIIVGDVRRSLTAVPSVDARGSAVVARSVTVNLTANDRLVRIARVEFYVDNETSPRYFYAHSVPTGWYTWLWDVSTETAGDHNLTAKAYDELGNVAVIRRLVTIVAIPATSGAPGSANMGGNMVTLLNGMNVCVPQGWRNNQALLQGNIADCIQNLISKMTPVAMGAPSAERAPPREPAPSSPDAVTPDIWRSRRAQAEESP